MKRDTLNDFKIMLNLDIIELTESSNHIFAMLTNLIKKFSQ